ncbi:MlaC/ttg2D family ABC transporter substrate-binding protein [Teredinibacter haidensis]|uniref:MlaC/ttg2D family ABC transporter substrate-binding protein n=1 Tax=Teredinibacter haidensis TaxID=2731755 RepID=UPI001FE5B16C|nr:ABC transporter substrate-binding protein [Teredinibacter haidensis]
MEVLCARLGHWVFSLSGWAKKILASLFFLLALVQGVQADESSAEPGAVVESLTNQLLDIARTQQDKLKADPEGFYSNIETVLEPMVGFSFIAKNVMGDTYWEQATDAQQEQFLVVFRRSLVETYAKGMSQNMDFGIELLKEESKITKTKASIVQKVTSPDSVNYIVYSLGLGKSGQWKVLNLVLDGVNLGKTFRSQFAQSVKESGGNLDAAIASWAKAPGKS